MADDKKADPRNVMLANVRLFFPVLFVPRAYKDEPGKAKKYSAKFGVLKTDPQVNAVKAAIVEAAKAQPKWAGKWEQILKQLAAENRICMFDGDIKDTSGYAGNFVVSASNEVRPIVLSRARTPLTDQDGVLYSGCYVNASISFWAQDNQWGKRINANLRGVQFFQDGEAFVGGGTASVDEFQAQADAPGATTEALSALGF